MQTTTLTDVPAAHQRYARTNPAFKRTQLLPVILNLLPPTTETAARPFGFILPATAVDLQTTNVLTQSTVNAGGRCQFR